MADIKYISEFLTRVEGPRQTRGYIPCFVRTGGTANYKGDADPGIYTVMGASGVTIATGCDLGQTTLDTLREYGIHKQALLQTLVPYIGLKKSAAINALYKKPLMISMEDAEIIDHAVHGGYLDKYVRPAYDRDSSVKFDDLPKQAQAVVMSLCFQKGCGGVRRDWPKTWKYLTTQNWAAASHELQYGFTQYKNRRRIEGQLLEELV